VAACVR
jgi:hypothetical protein